MSKTIQFRIGNSSAAILAHRLSATNGLPTSYAWAVSGTHKGTKYGFEAAMQECVMHALDNRTAIAPF